MARVYIQRTLRSSRALVLAQAASSLPRRPFRAPLARRLPRIPSPERLSLESQQDRSPLVHWSLAPPRARDSVRDMAVAEAARARTAEMVNFILKDWFRDCVRMIANDEMDAFFPTIEAMTLYAVVFGPGFIE